MRRAGAAREAFIAPFFEPCERLSERATQDKLPSTHISDPARVIECVGRLFAGYASMIITERVAAELCVSVRKHLFYVCARPSWTSPSASVRSAEDTLHSTTKGVPSHIPCLLHKIAGVTRVPLGAMADGSDAANIGFFVSPGFSSLTA